MEKNKPPEVSICIPAYNQTAYLKILLESIAWQTFTGYEIIVSDDSTTTDVKDLVTAFNFGEKLKYFRNEPPLGSPANWNAAIKKASGKYIKIMHHDDAFNSITALAEMMNYIKANDYDYIFSDSAIDNVRDSSQNRIHRIRNFDKLVKKPWLLFFGNSIGGPSALLIKAGELKQLDYDPKFIWLVDIEYYTRLLKSNCKGDIIPKPLILTHDAADHRLTSAILRNAKLQIKEHAMLYARLSPKAPSLVKFFMQVYMTRLFFRFRLKDKDLTDLFIGKPRLLRIYFSLIRFKPLYFAYRIFIQFLDISRKFLF